MSKLHNQAAPVIRAELLRAVHKGKTATLKRDQAAAMAQAYGLARALKIMTEAEDQSPAPGIGDGGWLPTGALDMTREYLKLDADLVLGTDPAAVEPRYLPAPDVPTILRMS